MVKNWKKIRIVLLIILVIIQWFTYILGLQTLSEPQINIDNIISISIYIFIGISLLIIISTIYIGDSSKRYKIDWNETIFTLSNPIQFFNYTGWVLVTSIILPVLHSYIVDSQYLVDNIFILSFSISIILSTHFTTFLFKKFYSCHQSL